MVEFSLGALAGVVVGSLVVAFCAMRMIRPLLQDCKVLKAEIDLLTDECARLDKELNEQLEVKQSTDRTMWD